MGNQYQTDTTNIRAAPQEGNTVHGYECIMRVNAQADVVSSDWLMLRLMRDTTHSGIAYVLVLHFSIYADICKHLYAYGNFTHST